jgi:ADP-ribose pyrophosphatase YjhB (NUDIX family)
LEADGDDPARWPSQRGTGDADHFLERSHDRVTAPCSAFAHGFRPPRFSWRPRLATPPQCSFSRSTYRKGKVVMTYATGVGLHLILLREDQVLLGRRRNTGYADGWWHLPAGGLEAGESVTAGMAREAREELGMFIDEAELQLVHILHDLDTDEVGRLQLFFTADTYQGEPTNCEPDKCSELRWWPLTALPEPTVPYIRVTLAGIAAGRQLTVQGFG